jgi:hypothetical protein
MGTILRKERIESLAIDSITTVSLPSSIVTIGGQQFENSSALTMDITTNGAGGLDTGAVAADTVYFIHAVKNSSTMSIISSLSETAPTGFTVFKRIGRFITSGSSEITSLATFIKDDETNWSTFTTWDLSLTAGTPPTKGSTIVVDRIRWRQDKEDYLVEGELEFSNAGGNGAGEYTLLLPGGIEADLVKKSLGSGFGAGNRAIAKGEIGIGFISNDTVSDGRHTPVLFSSTTLKFMAEDSTNNLISTWSSSFYQFSIPLGVSFKGRFPGEGL